MSRFSVVGRDIPGALPRKLNKRRLLRRAPGSVVNLELLQGAGGGNAGEKKRSYTIPGHAPQRIREQPDSRG